MARALSGTRRPPILTRPAGALLPGPSGAALGLHPGDRREETGPLQTDRTRGPAAAADLAVYSSVPCPSLRLELLRKGLHFLLDPAFYQQLEAAAGVWKVIADEDLLAGLPGCKRETTGTRDPTPAHSGERPGKGRLFESKESSDSDDITGNCCKRDQLPEPPLTRKSSSEPRHQDPVRCTPRTPESVHRPRCLRPPALHIGLAGWSASSTTDDVHRFKILRSSSTTLSPTPPPSSHDTPT